MWAKHHLAILCCLTTRNQLNMEGPDKVARLNNPSSSQATTRDDQCSIASRITEFFVVYKVLFPELNGAVNLVVRRDSKGSERDPVSLL